MIHGINMKGINRHKFAFLLTFCFILSSISPLVIADDETGLTSTINSNWLGDENHGYIIKFNRAPSADELGDISVKTTHYFGNQEINNQTNFSWGNGLGILDLNLLLLPAANIIKKLFMQIYEFV